MNPITWAINNIKGDIKAVKTIMDRAKSGEPQLDPEKKAMFWKTIKSIRPIDYLRDSWIWLLLLAFVATATWLVAGQYYQVQCNNFIIETYVIPELEKQAALRNLTAPSWDFNFTLP